MTTAAFPTRSPLRRALAAAALLAVGFTLPFAVAEGESQEAAPIARTARAKRHVEDLPGLLEILRRNPSVEASTRDRLLTIIRDARHFTRPIEASELTEEEADALRKELTDSGERRRSDFGERMRTRLLDQAVEGVGLSEEEEATARQIVGEWFSASAKARAKGDSKGVSDLVRERDKELKKVLGRRQAKQVITNLNSLSGWNRPK